MIKIYELLMLPVLKMYLSHFMHFQYWNSSLHLKVYAVITVVYQFSEALSNALTSIFFLY